MTRQSFSRRDIVRIGDMPADVLLYDDIVRTANEHPGMDLAEMNDCLGCVDDSLPTFSPDQLDYHFSHADTVDGRLRCIVCHVFAFNGPIAGMRARLDGLNCSNGAI